MINNIGITTGIGINIQSWYISSLLLVLLFYFYMMKYLSKPVVNIIISIITLFCYSFLIHIQNGSLTGEIETYYNIFNVGIMRALAGCGLGYLIGNSGICNTLNAKQTIIYRLVIGLLELIILAFLIYNMFFHKLSYTNDMIFVLAFVFLFIIFIKNNGILSYCLSNKFSNLIGKYAYSIFMTHRICFAILSVTLWKTSFVIQHSYLTILCSIVTATILGIVIYYLIEKPSTIILKPLLFKNK